MSLSSGMITASNHNSMLTTFRKLGEVAATWATPKQVEEVVELVMELITLLLQVVMVVLVEVDLHKVMHLEVLVTHLR